MSFQRWGHTVEGCWRDPGELSSRSGVYIIWTGNAQPSNVIDVGESHDVLNRVLNHDRAACWRKHSNGRNIWYSAIYTPDIQQPGRREIEQEIRRIESPVCGDR